MLFGLSKKYAVLDFEKVSVDELELVGGGSGGGLSYYTNPKASVSTYVSEFADPSQPGGISQYLNSYNSQGHYLGRSISAGYSYHHGWQ